MEPEEQKRYNRVLDIIDKRLIPDKTAKEQRGEVFTPLELVREMLFGLRKDKLDRGVNEIWGLKEDGSFFDDDIDNRVGGIPIEIWRDPETKWLDPANGIGNFPVVAFYMIDYQLGNHGPTEYKGDKNLKKRRKHIVENMLYMIEIDKGNVNASRKIFRLICPDAIPNIICANTLMLSEDDLKKQFGVNRFDVIMGNPPFNEGGIKSKGANDYKTIWTHFIFNSDKYKFPGAINLLNKDGYICFINPSSFCHKNNELFDKYFKFNIIILRMYSNTQTDKLFGGNKNATVRSAYYILKNTNFKEKIDIINIDGILELLHTSYINEFGIKEKGNTIFEKVYSKISTIKNILLSEGKKKKCEKGPYKYIKSHLQKGICYCLCNDKFKYQNNPKIIFKGSSKLYHYPDENGEFGVYGNWGYYILFTDKLKLKRFSNCLNLKLSKFLMESSKEDQDFIEPKYIPNFNEIQDITINEENIYKYFKFNKNEIELLNKFKDYNNNIDMVLSNCDNKFNTNKTLKSKTAATKGGSYPTHRFTQTRKQRKH